MEVLYIILGWLLGLLSPAIVKKISKKKERENLKKVIFSDLEELKKRLAPLSFKVYPKYGRLDHETFNWLKINAGIDFLSRFRFIDTRGSYRRTNIELLQRKRWTR